MTKIDIVSGFLGAGKTTLINKLIKEAYCGEKLVLIENEFGEIGIDGGFLQDAGVNITEMNSGCICCSLVGDFADALRKVITEYSPDRVLIEPSGVGKLSDVIRAVSEAELSDAVLNSYTTVVDATKCKMYIKNFGEFFCDQIEKAGCIIFSHTDKVTESKLSEACQLVKAHNGKATMITTPLSMLSGADILDAMEGKGSVEAELAEMLEHHHEHHHHDDEECCCHEHHHEHHHHDDECCCHEHGHEHHHHHADEVFTSWGRETVRKYSAYEMSQILKALDNSDKFGMVLRAKGIVPCVDGTWLHFDYVPGEPDIRHGSSAVTGKLCVIGSGLCEDAISALFGVK